MLSSPQIDERDIEQGNLGIIHAINAGPPPLDD